MFLQVGPFLGKGNKVTVTQRASWVSALPEGLAGPSILPPAAGISNLLGNFPLGSQVFPSIWLRLAVSTDKQGGGGGRGGMSTERETGSLPTSLWMASLPSVTAALLSSLSSAIC